MVISYLERLKCGAFLVLSLLTLVILKQRSIFKVNKSYVTISFFLSVNIVVPALSRRPILCINYKNPFSLFLAFLIKP